VIEITLAQAVACAMLANALPLPAHATVAGRAGFQGLDANHLWGMEAQQDSG